MLIQGDSKILALHRVMSKQRGYDCVKLGFGTHGMESEIMQFC